MLKLIRNGVLAGAFLALISFTGATSADDWPMSGGDYWEVTGIDVKDGGAWAYANWLATEWRKNSEFAKSKGWIKDYMILSNVHGRAGEADLYIIRVVANVPTGAEGEKRADEYQAWSKKSSEKMVAESGNRVEYREVLSTSLLQVMSFK